MATTIRSMGVSLGANTIFATNEKPVDMFSKMFENYPGLTPLTSILTKLSSAETANSRVDWTEQEKIPTTVVSTAPATSGAATLTIADFAYLRNHDFLFNPRTFEKVKVQDTSLDSSVSVIRGWGDTTGAAVLSGDEWEILNSSYHEGYDESNPRSPVNTNFYNYTNETVQFIQTSKRTMNEKTFFSGKGGKRMENQGSMWRMFREKMEKDVLYSYRSSVVSTQSGYTANHVRTMGGLVEKLKDGTNFFDVGGVLTESEFDNWLVKIYTGMPDSTRLTAFLSPKVYQILNNIVKPLIRVSPNVKAYGMAINQYQGAVNLDLIPHPLLHGPELGGWMFLLDLDKIKLIYQDRPKLELDTYVTRAGYIEDKYSAMYTLLAANEKRHGMAVGITG